MIRQWRVSFPNKVLPLWYSKIFSSSSWCNLSSSSYVHMTINHKVMELQRQKLLVALLYHVPHPSQLNTQKSRLSQFWVITAHAEPLRKSTHFLHQYTSPFTTLPSVLFYKEGLYIFTQHSSKHWRGSLFTSLPHHHLVRVGVNTSILILVVSILLYFLQASLIAYAIWQFELK
jgi:hypothetical protein